MGNAETVVIQRMLKATPPEKRLQKCVMRMSIGWSHFLTVGVNGTVPPHCGKGAITKRQMPFRNMKTRKTARLRLVL